MTPGTCIKSLLHHYAVSLSLSKTGWVDLSEKSHYKNCLILRQAQDDKFL